MAEIKQRKPFLFTFRNHKKKCIFFAAVGLWGTNYAIKQFRDYLRRRKFCYEGKRYGAEKIAAISKPRRLLLFLNPEANDGKALKSYEKNAAPILHLGGLEITTVKTDYEGQCKALTQYLDPTIDGIIVAGGDGTLLEIVTGLLRRKDQEQISKIPIGLIPLGRKNHSYNNVVDNTVEEDVQKIAKAAINILNWKTKDISVMEIKSSEGRPTYAVDHIEWGALRDAKENKKFWWTGPLKRRLPYVLATLKRWPPKISAHLSFSSRDSSSSHQVDHQVSSDNSLSLQPTSTQHNMSPEYLQSGIEKPAQQLSKETDVIQTNNTISLFGFFVKLLQNSTETYLHTSVLPSEVNKLEFVNCGWKLEAEGTLSNDNIKTAEMREFELQPLDEQISWYTIDGEKFEARPIHVKILRKKIRVFCPST